jgi:hypothetical protein
LWVASNPVPAQAVSSWFYPPGLSNDASAGGNLDATSYNNEAETILQACTIDAMQVRNYIPNNTSGVTVQLYKNNSPQSLSCSTKAAVGSACAITGQSISVGPGDSIALQISNVSSRTGYVYSTVHCN